MGDTIRVLLADDHEIVREELRMILEMQHECAVVGESADGVAAVELAAKESPDVILMDLKMPRLDGLGALQRIRAAQPEIAIVILASNDEDYWLMRSLKAGARAYLPKDAAPETLFNTIRAAVRGESLLQPEILGRVLAHTDIPRVTSRYPRVSLTSRELEILRNVASGSRNKEIAIHLSITSRTVKAHLENIYAKLGVDSRTAAVTVALQRGLLNS